MHFTNFEVSEARGHRCQFRRDWFGFYDAFVAVNTNADAGISALLTETNPGASDQLRKCADALLDSHQVALEALGGSKRFVSRCGSHCPEFVERLTAVIRRDHLRRVEARQHGTLDYLGEKVGKSVTVVKTRVTIAVGKTTRTQKVDYVMHKVHRARRVRDIVLDGVSLSAMQRGAGPLSRGPQL